MAEIDFWQTMLGARPAPPRPAWDRYDPNYNALPGMVSAVGQVPGAIRDIRGESSGPSLNAPPPASIEQVLQARAASAPSAPQPETPTTAGPGSIEEAAYAPRASRQAPEPFHLTQTPPAPEWGGVSFGDGGPSVLTAGQLEQDEIARGGIEARHGARIRSIEEAAARNDPVAKRIAAQRQERDYESALPYGSESSIDGSFGEGWGPGMEGSEIVSASIGRRALGVPSIEDALQIQRERSRQLPAMMKAQAEAGRDQATTQETMGRLDILEELRLLQQDLAEDVRAKRRTPVDAESTFTAALRKAAISADIAKPGGSASGYLRNDFGGSPGQ